MHILNKFFLLIVITGSGILYSYQEGFANNGDVRIAYRDYGPKDGKPILLVTGLGAQLTLWPQFLINNLQENNFRPIAFDNRDVGLSTRFSSEPSQFVNYLKYYLFIQVESEYTIEDMAVDGISVLDELNIKKAHILGMSMGGMISQIMVANFPTRFHTFTMISSTSSTPTPFNGPKLKVTRQLLKRVKNKDDIDGRINQSIKLFELIGTPGKNYDTPEFRKKMRAYIKRGGDDSGFLRQIAAIIGSKNRKDILKSIKTPTLIIHGDLDPLINVNNAFKSNKLIDNSYLIIVEDMGHLLDLSSYKKFQSELITFLKS